MEPNEVKVKDDLQEIIDKIEKLEDYIMPFLPQSQDSGISEYHITIAWLNMAWYAMKQALEDLS